MTSIIYNRVDRSFQVIRFFFFWYYPENGLFRQAEEVQLPFARDATNLVEKAGGGLIHLQTALRPLVVRNMLVEVKSLCGN